MPNEIPRCPVCKTALRVIRGTPEEIWLGCQNKRYPGNKNQPCVRYVDAQSPNPDLITIQAVSP